MPVAVPGLRQGGAVRARRAHVAPTAPRARGARQGRRHLITPSTSFPSPASCSSACGTRKSATPSFATKHARRQGHLSQHRVVLFRVVDWKGTVLLGAWVRLALHAPL